MTNIEDAEHDRTFDALRKWSYLDAIEYYWTLPIDNNIEFEELFNTTGWKFIDLSIEYNLRVGNHQEYRRGKYT